MLPQQQSRTTRPCIVEAIESFEFGGRRTRVESRGRARFFFNWLRCWFVSVDPQAGPIAMHRSQTEWTRFVRRVFEELARVLRSGGHVAFEVGEVRKGAVELETLVFTALDGLPFDLLGVMVNVQSFTKTANCRGVANNAKGTNTNRIVLARRL